MSKEFERALRVISKAPEQRQNHEIQSLVPWLRGKAKLFKTLKAGEMSRRQADRQIDRPAGRKLDMWAGRKVESQIA